MTREWRKSYTGSLGTAQLGPIQNRAARGERTLHELVRIRHALLASPRLEHEHFVTFKFAFRSCSWCAIDDGYGPIHGPNKHASMSNDN